MTISEIITIVTNRLNTLNQARTHAVSVGDLHRVSAIDADIAETETSLAQLQQIAT